MFNCALVYRTVDPVRKAEIYSLKIIKLERTLEITLSNLFFHFISEEAGAQEEGHDLLRISTQLSNRIEKTGF
jgi:hypothetical protein